MTFGRQIAAMIFCASIAFGWAPWAPRSSASAGESGSFSAIMGFSTTYTAINFAGSKVTGGSLRGPSTVTRSSGPPFVEGESNVRVCIVYAKQTSEGVKLEAPCVVTDEAGDELYLLATRSVGDVSVGGGGAGKQQIVGGTGKYAGMTGSCDYTVAYLPGDLGVTQMACEWQKL